jgi:hypothetical protein
MLATPLLLPRRDLMLQIEPEAAPGQIARSPA